MSKSFPVCVTATLIISYAFLLPSHASDAREVTNVRGWSILHEPSGNGACYAIGEYRGGTAFGIGKVGPAERWSSMITNPKWKSIQIGSTYKVKYIFDRRRSWTGDEIGIKNGFMSEDLKEDFVRDFARSSGLQIFYSDKEVDTFKLSGTRAAINAVVECYDKNVKTTDPFAQVDPFNSDKSEIEPQLPTQPFSSDNTKISPSGKWDPNSNDVKIVSINVAICNSEECPRNIATVQGKKGFDNSYSISVNFEGVPKAAELVIPADGISGSVEFYALNVDQTNSVKEITVIYYTGGAHCCSRTVVFSKTKSQVSLADLGFQDGDRYEFQDKFELDPVFTFSDNRFLYLFGPYVDSGTPLKMMIVSDGKSIDVTPIDKFKEFHRKNMEFYADGCREGRNSHCAAYVASATRIGKYKNAWDFMLKHYTSKRKDADIWLPEFCESAVPANTECPQNRKLLFNDFPDALNHVLKEWGYLQ